MANINKVKISGTTYNIEDLNATKTIELSQAEYNALGEIDPNTFYVITDSDGVDLTDYYTKSETSGSSEIATALNGKQDVGDYLITATSTVNTNNQISAMEVDGVDTSGFGFYNFYEFKFINGNPIFRHRNVDYLDDAQSYGNLSLMETSAITTAMTSSSTNSQVPSAKAVHDQVGGLKFVSITQSDYEALETKDTNTVYFVQEDASS